MRLVGVQKSSCYVFGEKINPRLCVRTGYIIGSGTLAVTYCTYNARFGPRRPPSAAARAAVVGCCIPHFVDRTGGV